MFWIADRGLSGYLEAYVKPTGHHAAIQYHQRTVAHAGTGCPVVRQHDERHDDSRHPVEYHAFIFPIV